MDREEQVKSEVPCSRTQHATHMGFKLTTLVSWVQSSTTELHMPLSSEAREKQIQLRQLSKSWHTKENCQYGLFYNQGTSSKNYIAALF